MAVPSEELSMDQVGTLDAAQLHYRSIVHWRAGGFNGQARLCN